MRHKLQFLTLGILIGTILTNGAVIAKNGSEMLEAFYSDIKIYIDGSEIAPKDANGNSVEPFIYNGTTYLPVRAVGEALGKTVLWDSATNSVYLITPEETEENSPETTVPEKENEETKTAETTPSEDKTEENETTPEKDNAAASVIYNISTNNVQQFLNFKAEDIKSSRLKLFTSEIKWHSEFSTTVSLNDGTRYEIEATEITSLTESGLDGYFKVTKNGTVIYEKLLGTVTVNGTTVTVHTDEVDLNIIADKKDKLIYADWGNVRGFQFEVSKFNEKAASGYMSISYDETNLQATANGEITVGTDKYFIKMTEATTITKNELSGFFTITKNGETITENISGTFSDLETALGEYLTFTAENSYTINLRLVSFNYK